MEFAFKWPATRTILNIKRGYLGKQRTNRRIIYVRHLVFDVRARNGNFPIEGRTHQIRFMCGNFFPDDRRDAHTERGAAVPVVAANERTSRAKRRPFLVLNARGDEDRIRSRELLNSLLIHVLSLIYTSLPRTR